jgi:hypothetical protein
VYLAWDDKQVGGELYMTTKIVIAQTTSKHENDDGGDDETQMTDSVMTNTVTRQH